MTHPARAWPTWLRWTLPVALLGAFVQAPDAPRPPLASGSGDHAWWVTREGDAWVVQHAPRESAAPVRREVGRFDDEPVAIACDGASAWVVFRGALGRCEVLAFEAARNPASGLWFSVPSSGRLCASVPVDRFESVAACEGEPWVSVAGSDTALRLRGERWIESPLPAGSAAAAQRTLVTRAGSLWCLARMPDGTTRRWRAGDGAWRVEPIEVAAWSAVVPGSELLTLIVDGRLAAVQAGRAGTGETMPAEAAVVGWGGGYLALQSVGAEVRASRCDGPGARFGAPEIVPPQRSLAARWFHLPLLGVLSLGALMLAGTVRAVRSGVEAPGPAPLKLGRRFVALCIDLLPLGASSLLAFDADLTSLLRAPLWTTDLRDSVPFVTMVVAAGAFGFAEEAAGARSLGKRLTGGAVRRTDGARAAAWRHLVRNLLKMLLMLSPVLALPTLLGRRGEGIPETVSGTRVVSD